MSTQKLVRLTALLCGISLSTAAHAFFFFIPIPNLAKPAQLNTLIETLERSDQTKALAYVSEDKTFGAKYYVWGHYAGTVTQADADQRALGACRLSLSRAKDQKAGGKEMYDYGTKDCELYQFVNKTVSLPLPVPASPAPIAPRPAVTIATPTPISTIGWQVYDQINDWAFEFNVNSIRVEADNLFFEYRNRNLTNPGDAAPAVQAVANCKTRKRSDLQSDGSYELHDAYSGTDKPKQIEAVCKFAPINQQAASSSEPAAIAPITAPVSQIAESPTARKLRELNQLRKDGLVTEREYNDKRKAILSAM